MGTPELLGGLWVGRIITVSNVEAGFNLGFLDVGGVSKTMGGGGRDVTS